MRGRRLSASTAIPTRPGRSASDHNLLTSSGDPRSATSLAWMAGQAPRKTAMARKIERIIFTGIRPPRRSELISRCDCARKSTRSPSQRITGPWNCEKLGRKARQGLCGFCAGSAAEAWLTVHERPIKKPQFRCTCGERLTPVVGARRLKILWTERSVRVRVPPPAPIKSSTYGGLVVVRKAS